MFVEIDALLLGLPLGITQRLGSRHPARQHGVDRDLPRSKFVSPALCRADQRELRGAISAVTGSTDTAELR